MTFEERIANAVNTVAENIKAFNKKYGKEVKS